MERAVQHLNTTEQYPAHSTHFVLPRSFARLWMGFVLLFSDLLSILISAGLALFLWHFVRSDLIIQSYLNLIPLIFVFALVYTICRLYPAVGVGPVEELRLLTISTTIVFMWLGTLSFYVHNFQRFSRASFGIAWVIALFLVPISRNIFRTICSASGFWGEPVAIIGFGERGYQILKFLGNNLKLGYRPVVIIDGFSSPVAPPIPQYQEEGLLAPAKIHSLEGIKTAILITKEIPTEFLTEVVEGRWYKFHHLILISNDHNNGSLWIQPHDIGGILGLEVRQNLFSDWQQTFKRIVDLGLVIIISPIFCVLFSILTILIRLDSRGPIFYCQKRIGKNGREITIWKFRTMVENSGQAFKAYLEQHPDLQSEWDKNQKIKKDPRITRIGKILRRLSLDELPQILNVLRGDMSLVGPRPIVNEEIQYYGNLFHLYTKVKPGLTGLWQVSGRNDTTYEQRVHYDEYYVRNWSIWIDIYILARTVGAVITGKGAY